MSKFKRLMGRLEIRTKGDESFPIGPEDLEITLNGQVLNGVTRLEFLATPNNIIQARVDFCVSELSADLPALEFLAQESNPLVRLEKRQQEQADAASTCKGHRE